MPRSQSDSFSIEGAHSHDCNCSSNGHNLFKPAWRGDFSHLRQCLNYILKIFYRGRSGKKSDICGYLSDGFEKLLVFVKERCIALFNSNLGVQDLGEVGRYPDVNVC